MPQEGQEATVHVIYAADLGVHCRFTQRLTGDKVRW